MYKNIMFLTENNNHLTLTYIYMLKCVFLVMFNGQVNVRYITVLYFTHDVMEWLGNLIKDMISLKCRETSAHFQDLAAVA